jgi:hypothetical protein
MTRPKALPPENVESKIPEIRGQRVMLDRDLANVYGVTTGGLNQAVKRNQDRFPEDFIFRLTQEEAEEIRRSRSQSVILKRGQNFAAVRSTLQMTREAAHFTLYASGRSGQANATANPGSARECSSAFAHATSSSSRINTSSTDVSFRRASQVSRALRIPVADLLMDFTLESVRKIRLE